VSKTGEAQKCLPFRKEAWRSASKDMKRPLTGLIIEGYQGGGYDQPIYTREGGEKELMEGSDRTFIRLDASYKTDLLTVKLRKSLKS